MTINEDAALPFSSGSARSSGASRGSRQRRCGPSRLAPGPPSGRAVDPRDRGASPSVPGRNTKRVPFTALCVFTPSRLPSSLTRAQWAIRLNYERGEETRKMHPAPGAFVALGRKRCMSAVSVKSRKGDWLCGHTAARGERCQPTPTGKAVTAQGPSGPLCPTRKSPAVQVRGEGDPRTAPPANGAFTKPSLSRCLQAPNSERAVGVPCWGNLLVRRWMGAQMISFLLVMLQRKFSHLKKYKKITRQQQT